MQPAFFEGIPPVLSRPLTLSAYVCSTDHPPYHPTHGSTAPRHFGSRLSQPSRRLASRQWRLPSWWTWYTVFGWRMHVSR